MLTPPVAKLCCIASGVLNIRNAGAASQDIGMTGQHWSSTDRRRGSLWGPFFPDGFDSFFFCLVVSMSFFIRPRYVRGDRCAPIVLIAETCLERLPQAPWETMLWHFFVAFAQDREGDMGTWHSYHGFGNHWDQELGWKTPIQAQKNSWRRVPCPERIIRKLGEQTNSSHMPPSEPMEKCMMSWCTWQVFCQPKFCPHFLLTDCPLNGPPYSSSQWSRMVHLVRSQVLMNTCSWWVMGNTQNWLQNDMMDWCMHVLIQNLKRQTFVAMGWVEL